MLVELVFFPCNSYTTNALNLFSYFTHYRSFELYHRSSVSFCYHFNRDYAYMHTQNVILLQIFRCFTVFQFSIWTFIRKFIESFMFAVNFLLFTLIFILNERKHTANKRKLMVNFFLCRLFFTYFVSETENNWNLHCGKNDDIFKNIICFWFISMIFSAPPRI